MDMRIHWMRDRIKQEQFHLYWKPGQQNLADYPTKHHSGKHHKKVRPIYLYEDRLSPVTVQGCIEIMGEAYAKPSRTRTSDESNARATRAARKHVTWWDKPKSFMATNFQTENLQRQSSNPYTYTTKSSRNGPRSILSFLV